MVYAGAPQFVAIPGTPMQYAVNTSFNVIQTGEGFYSCYQGAWFARAGARRTVDVGADGARGDLHDSAVEPDVSVHVSCASMRSTPETVTYGYTAGYTMSYVSAGVIVYGTGYYYPPYIYPAPIPIYYPYPYSYAGATYYNSTTGAWAQGGAIYGPYGGVAKAGYAYNPNTGAWAQGGAIYGPNGGAGAFSAYNPSTGSYAHGSAVWGPDGASGNASWYNANTGRSGSTQQNSNAYGRWGSSTISGPNQTVHTQSQSNAQGSRGLVHLDAAARKGAAVSGAGGNTAGAVKTTGGDVYAGADGNVYKKTDSGWQKYDNGSWNSVQKPANADHMSGRRSARAANRRQQRRHRIGATGARQRAPARRATSASSARRLRGMGQLEQDRSARMMGGQRQQQFESMRGGGGFAGRGGGGLPARRFASARSDEMIRGTFIMHATFRHSPSARHRAPRRVEHRRGPMGDARAARGRPGRADVAAIAAERRRELRHGGGDARSARRQGLRDGRARRSRTRRASR